MYLLVAFLALGLTQSGNSSSQKTLDDRLIGAVQSGDAKMIRELLESGADPNARDEYDLSALTWSAMKSQLKAAEILLEAGAKVNPRPSQIAPAGFPLARAAGVGDLRIVKLLLDEGAEVNKRDKEGTTPLFKAVHYTNNRELILTLLKAGADLHASDNEGRTALMQAAGAGRAENVRLLLSEGADVNAQSVRGQTALMYAANWGHLETARLLVTAGAKIDAKLDDGRTAVDLAEANGHIAVVEFLKSTERKVGGVVLGRITSSCS